MDSWLEHSLSVVALFLQFTALACLKALASVMSRLGGWFLTPLKTRRSPLARWSQYAGLWGSEIQ